MGIDILGVDILGIDILALPRLRYVGNPGIIRVKPPHLEGDSKTHTFRHKYS